MSETVVGFEEDGVKYYVLERNLHSLIREWLKREGIKLTKVKHTKVDEHTRKTQEGKTKVKKHTRTTAKTVSLEPRKKRKRYSNRVRRYARKIKGSLSGIEKLNLVRVVEQSEVSLGEVDWKEDIDKTLSYYENKNKLKEKYHISEDPTDMTESEIEKELDSIEVGLSEKLRSLKARAEAGDPQAIAELEAMSGLELT